MRKPYQCLNAHNRGIEERNATSVAEKQKEENLPRYARRNELISKYIDSCLLPNAHIPPSAAWPCLPMPSENAYKITLYA